MKKLILAASLLLSTCAAPVMAQQTYCYPRDMMLEHLTNKFGESVQSYGIGNNRVMEVLANEETGSWSILTTNSDGVTCMVASGGSYEEVSEPVVQGDPT